LFHAGWAFVGDVPLVVSFAPMVVDLAVGWVVVGVGVVRMCNVVVTHLYCADSAAVHLWLGSFCVS
jgi:hypothetical protein